MNLAKKKIAIAILLLAFGFVLVACDFPTRTPAPCMPGDFPTLELVAPADFELLDSSTPTLSWNDPGADCVPSGYSLILGEDRDFSGATIGGVASYPVTFWTLDSPLSPGMEYWWKVAPITEEPGRILYGSYTSPWRFYTGPLCLTEELDTVSLIWPLDGEIIDTDVPRLEWQYPKVGCVPGGYRIDLSTDPTFTDPGVGGATGNPSTRWLPGIDLTDCLEYYWRVAPITGETLGAFSETRSFRVDLSSSCASGASISGDVFHDLCAVPYASIPPGDPLPEGCIDAGPVDGLEADGVYDLGEPGIEGVTLHLGSGACPSTGLSTDTTIVDGSYTFGGLSAGTYCVSVDALSDGNDLILIPGGWTYPSRGDNPQNVTITLVADQHESDVDFGWDYQFLPEPPAPTATATPLAYTVRAIKNANCRTGPMTLFDQYGFLLEGEQAEAVGRLADSSWLLVQLMSKQNHCWIAENLLTYSFNVSDLAVFTSPPTPTPAPGGISGVVWDDECDPPNFTPETPEPPPPGCETDGLFYWANGILEAGEQGIPNVIVHLGAGPCPAAGLPTTTTNASGVYSFSGLTAGNYCVSVSVVGNENALIPGTWSHPDVTGNWARFNVTVNPGATTGNVNFGWDFQF